MGLKNEVTWTFNRTEKGQLLLFQVIEVTQTRYDCGGLATQIFLQVRWISDITLFELEDFQFSHLYNVSLAIKYGF